MSGYTTIPGRDVEDAEGEEVWSGEHGDMGQQHYGATRSQSIGGKNFLHKFASHIHGGSELYHGLLCYSFASCKWNRLSKPSFAEANTHKHSRHLHLHLPLLTT